MGSLRFTSSSSINEHGRKVPNDAVNEYGGRKVTSDAMQMTKHVLTLCYSVNDANEHGENDQRRNARDPTRMARKSTQVKMFSRNGAKQQQIKRFIPPSHLHCTRCSNSTEVLPFSHLHCTRCSNSSTEEVFTEDHLRWEEVWKLLI